MSDSVLIAPYVGDRSRPHHGVQCWTWLRRYYSSLARISDDYFELFFSLGNVWIDQPLMPSSDVTTQKLGSDYDWSIVKTFA